MWRNSTGLVHDEAGNVAGGVDVVCGDQVDGVEPVGGHQVGGGFDARHHLHSSSEQQKQR